jgi:hypothetical protein
MGPGFGVIPREIWFVIFFLSNYENTRHVEPSCSTALGFDAGLKFEIIPMWYTWHSVAGWKIQEIALLKCFSASVMWLCTIHCQQLKCQVCSICGKCVFLSGATPEIRSPVSYRVDYVTEIENVRKTKWKNECMNLNNTWTITEQRVLHCS